MPTKYQDLRGGVGKNIYFRAERFRVRECLEYQDVQLMINQESYLIHDISMNGILFYAQQLFPGWEVGSRLPIQLSAVDKNELFCSQADSLSVFYEGKARISRIETTRKGYKVGLLLQDGFLDLPAIERRYQERLLQWSLKQGPGQLFEQVPRKYIDAAHQVAFFVQFYRACLTRHEERGIKSGDENGDWSAKLADRALESIRPQWKALIEQAAEASLDLLQEPGAMTAAKKYAETMITPLLMDCPILCRAYTKPLGYAGDHHVMRHMYRNQLEGPTAFAKVFQKLVTEEPLAEGGRNRKDLLKQFHIDEYRRFSQNANSSDVFRVTSVGSGPAREVVEFIQDQKTWTSPIDWTLLEQSEEALSLAYKDLYPLIVQAGGGKSLSCLYTSFKELFRDPSMGLVEKDQHLIYAAGLFDYLPAPIAKALVSVLYNRLVPGGLLVIGNAVWPNNHFWVAEFVLDWSLLYRTKEQMLDLAEYLGSDIQREVISEPAKAHFLLLIRKK